MAENYYYEPDVNELFPGYSDAEIEKVKKWINTGGGEASSQMSDLKEMMKAIGRMKDSFGFIKEAEKLMAGEDIGIYGQIPPNLPEVVEQAKQQIIGINQRIETIGTKFSEQSIKDTLQLASSGDTGGEGDYVTRMKFRNLPEQLTSIINTPLEINGSSFLGYANQPFGPGTDNPYSSLKGFISDDAPTREKSGLGMTLLSAAAGLIPGAGIPLATMIGAINQGAQKDTDIGDWLAGGAKGALAGLGGKGVGKLVSGLGKGAATAGAEALPEFTTPSMQGLDVGGQAIGDILGTTTGTQASTLGGNMGWLDELLNAPSYLDQIGGLSLPSEVGGQGWDMSSLMNIGDYLGGGGAASEIYPGVSGLQGILDPVSGELGSAGLNIAEILSNVGGGAAGVDWQKILKEVAKKSLGGEQPTGTQPAGTTGTDGASLTDYLQKILSGISGGAGAGSAGTFYPTTEMETPQPAQYPTAQDIMGEATQFAKGEFPLAYGARETGLGRLDEMAPGKEYWEGFGPTSFEEALGSQYFQNVMPEITKSIMHQQSLAGTAESPITAKLIADQARKAGVDVGTYLANLGQRRGELALQGTQQGIQSQLGIDPYSTTSPYAGLTQGQGNLQASENYQNALLRAKSQYMANIGKEQEQGAKIGSLSSIGGGILGGILGGVNEGGLDWTQGAGIGATLANILSPLWGGSGQSGGIGQVLSTLGGYNQNQQTPTTGQVQPVNQTQSQFGDFSTLWPAGGPIADLQYSF